MKRKIIISCVLMTGFSAASLYISYNVHWILMRQRNMCSTNPVVLISGLNEPRIRTFFIICLITSALFIVYMLVMQNYIKYKSDMRQITPDIQIPKAEGQGQYGTARWLDKSKFSKVFATVKADKNSTMIKKLISNGYNDEEEEYGDWK